MYQEEVYFSNLDTESDLHGETDILCPDAAGQAVHGVVGQGHGLLGRPEW